jgi:hypothetical protein
MGVTLELVPESDPVTLDPKMQPVVLVMDPPTETLEIAPVDVLRLKVPVAGWPVSVLKVHGPTLMRNVAPIILVPMPVMFGSVPVNEL